MNDVQKRKLRSAWERHLDMVTEGFKHTLKEDLAEAKAKELMAKRDGLYAQAEKLSSEKELLLAKGTFDHEIGPVEDKITYNEGLLLGAKIDMLCFQGDLLESESSMASVDAGRYELEAGAMFCEASLFWLKSIRDIVGNVVVYELDEGRSHDGYVVDGVRFEGRNEDYW